MKTIIPSKAPICCVIPPNSWSTTDVSLSESSRVVFPWSTWPITHTTGGRGFRASGGAGGARTASLFYLGYHSQDVLYTIDSMSSIKVQSKVKEKFNHICKTI